MLDAAITEMRAAGRAWSTAQAEVFRLAKLRGVEKKLAVLRIMGTPDAPTTNPLTGKAHSATSAEAIVEVDAEYSSFVNQCNAAEVQLIFAQTEYEAAKLIATHLAGKL